MSNFSDVIRVTIPDFSDEELDKILSKHDVDEVMTALGFEKKIKFNNLHGEVEKHSNDYSMLEMGNSSSPKSDPIESYGIAA